MKSLFQDNPFRAQLQLEIQFKLAKEMRNEDCYSMDEYHRLIGYLTQEFMVLQEIEPQVQMRWDFSDDPTGKVMMELTRAAIC